MEQHNSLLPECTEIFKRLEEKIDSLIIRADKVNGRYERHIDSSNDYRKQVDQNTIILKDLLNIKVWLRGVIFVIVLGILSTAVGWGSLVTSVITNTDRLIQIEQLHPRINIQSLELQDKEK